MHSLEVIAARNVKAEAREIAHLDADKVVKMVVIPYGGIDEYLRAKRDES